MRHNQNTWTLRNWFVPRHPPSLLFSVLIYSPVTSQDVLLCLLYVPTFPLPPSRRWGSFSSWLIVSWLIWMIAQLKLWLLMGSTASWAREPLQMVLPVNHQHHGNPLKRRRHHQSHPEKRSPPILCFPLNTSQLPFVDTSMDSHTGPPRLDNIRT